MSDIDVYKEWLGIPEGERPPDHYTILRLVQFEDSVEKIRENYRKLNAHVRKYATGQYLKRSQELLNELAKAMLCLTDPDAKHEYDESLGREFTGDTDESADTVLQYLVARNVIKRSQVSEIEHFADARGLTHRDAVIQMKLAEPEDATRALAAELRMSFIDLDDMLPEDDVLDRLPRHVVKRHSCLPLFEDRGKLLVACVDQPGPELEDEVRIRFGMPMRGVLAIPRTINQAIAKYYAAGMRDEAAPEAAPKATGKARGSKTEKPKPEKKARPQGKSAPLSDEEKSQRRAISLIAICWAVIGTNGLFYVLNDFVPPGFGQIAGSLVIGAAVAGILKLTYWK
ncbi:MAG: hypothetical protein R3C19_18425 [Planctomycetaceae bacterium]